MHPGHNVALLTCSAQPSAAAAAATWRGCVLLLRLSSETRRHPALRPAKLVLRAKAECSSTAFLICCALCSK